MPESAENFSRENPNSAPLQGVPGEVQSPGCPGCERCSDAPADTIRAMQVSPEFLAAVARDVEERKNLLASLKEHGHVACQPVGEEL